MQPSLLNTDVDLSFTVYNYDPDAKESFKCFHTNSDILHGSIQKQGQEYVMQIDSDPWTVPSISKSYTFTLGVVPKPQLQTIYKANSVKEQLVQQWENIAETTSVWQPVQVQNYNFYCFVVPCVVCTGDSPVVILLSDTVVTTGEFRPILFSSVPFAST